MGSKKSRGVTLAKGFMAPRDLKESGEGDEAVVRFVVLWNFFVYSLRYCRSDEAIRLIVGPWLRRHVPNSFYTAFIPGFGGATSKLLLHHEGPMEWVDGARRIQCPDEVLKYSWGCPWISYSPSHFPPPLSSFCTLYS